MKTFIKYFFLFSLALLPLLSFSQYDSTRNLQSIDAYGYSWKNAAFRHSIRIPKDTPKIAVKDSGCIAFKNNTIWTWSGYRWNQVSASGGGSASVDSALFVTITRLRDSMQLIRSLIPSAIDSAVYATVTRLRDSMAVIRGLIPEQFITDMQVVSVPYIDTLKFFNGSTMVRYAVIKKRNGLNFGCSVTKLSDTSFSVSAANYVANGVEYNSGSGTVITTSNRDTTGRYFVVGVDDTGFPIGVPGTNSVYPQVPQLTTSQVGCATVYMPPLSGTTILNNYTTNVYNAGVDSSALHTASQAPDSSYFVLCDLYGNCDTIQGIIDPRLVLRQELQDSLTALGSRIPAQFNPIAGTNITLSGSYPNITINSTSSGTSWSTDIIPVADNDKFMVEMSGVFRATASGSNQPITWAFLDTTLAGSHSPQIFDSIKGNGNAIQIYYPNMKYISSFHVAPDETLALGGVTCGASVGQNVANVYAYLVSNNAGKLTGNTTSWTNTGLNATGLSYNTSTGLTVFTPTTFHGTMYAGSSDVEGTIIQYVGNNNRRVRRAYSGLSGQLIGFYLVDSTNTIVTGNISASDIVVVNVPRPLFFALPAQTTASNGAPSDLYTSQANFWVRAYMERYIIGYPLSGTSVKLEWQTAKQGSGNYATNYRITRAPMSSPNSETTVSNGYNFSYTDTGLTTDTMYIYRMYATILGVESLISNVKVTPVTPQ